MPNSTPVSILQRTPTPPQTIPRSIRISEQYPWTLHLYYRPLIESYVGYYDICDFDIRSLRLDLMLLERLALRTEGDSSLQILALGLLDWAMGG